MRAIAIAWLVACSSDKPESAPTAPAIALTGCQPALPAPRTDYGFVPSGTPRADLGHPIAELTSVWTPYAAASKLADAGVARTVSRLATEALRQRLAAIDACVAGKRGSLRVMLQIAVDGSSSARAGGFGDKLVEDCVTHAVASVKLPAAPEPVEVACDLSTGIDTPWRVTPQRYTVIEVTRQDLRVGGKRYTDLQAAPPIASDASHLVLADADAPGARLDQALALAALGGPTLVAIRSSSGSPVFVAMGPSRGTPVEPRGVALRVEAGSLEACVSVPHHDRAAPLVDVRAVDAAMAAAVGACAACPREAWIGVDGELAAKDLVAAASVARRAGLEPIVVRGRACDPPR